MGGLSSAFLLVWWRRWIAVPMMGARRVFDFSKDGDMILQFRKPAFSSEQAYFKISEFDVASKMGFTPFDLLKEENRWPSCLRNAGMKSCGFSLRIGERGAHSFLNERESPVIGLSVALRRPKTE
jgi:hypothetical protein